ncbi:MAG: insulinase family protein [Deltaproteobacteria bacterium]|nr:insulinase family protein [Deltaproteobacteria bacterium]
MKRTHSLSLMALVSGLLASLGLSAVGGCGASPAPTPEYPALASAAGDAPAPSEEPAAERQAPPESGPSRDVQFPAVTRASVAHGLELNTVESHALPLVYLRLVIRSGGETDPANRPGIARLTASMLQEGTRTKTAAQLAEAVDFMGADLSVSATQENTYLVMRVLVDQLDEAMDLLADVATHPAFRQEELDKLKRRETDRLSLMSKRPSYLAQREFYKRLFGDHPYAHVDTTPEVVRSVRRSELARWHRRHFVPSNAFLVVTGDVTPEQAQTSAARAFARWSGPRVPAPRYATPPTRDAREVVLVDRPGSVQSVIYIGNLGVKRDAEDWIPLAVANQVLGGSAASRLFMDLRERRSLTYGAYSRVGEAVDVGTFRASASVRTQVTAQAMDAFFEHLNRIVSEPVPESELHDAERYLSDSFPLSIDTAGKIGQMVADLRVFGLPDDYWHSYRTRIGEVTPAQALTAARAHIDPEHALVVVVGSATDIAAGLRAWGPVTVVDENGEVKSRLEAAPNAATTQASE